MATTAAAAFQHHVVDEEELMALKVLSEPAEAEEVDASSRDMAAHLSALLRRLADMDAAGNLSPEGLAWAERMEERITQTAEEMARMAAEILRGSAVLEARPGEDAAVVAELRRQAGQATALAAEAGRVVAAARCLVEKETRRLAALEHVVDPDALGLLRRVAGEMDAAVEGGCGPAPQEVAEAAGAAELVEGEMAMLSLWLIMAAMDRSGEKALAAALRRQADKAEAALEAVDAFRASMRRYQAAGKLPGHARM